MAKMLLLFQILATAVTAYAFQCPPSNDIYPCVCREHLRTIRCEGAESLAELEPAVKNAIGHNASFLFLRSNLGDIPSDFFKGLGSEKLEFRFCNVRSFGDTPFNGLEDSLKLLYIFESIYNGTNLNSFSLSHLHSLEYVYFTDNDILELGDHWFKDRQESITEINFSNNKIYRIGLNAFANLVNLGQVYMIGNQFSAVARSMMPNPAEHVWFLDVSKNEIEELPVDSFEGYPSLQSVYLSKNKLKSIPENVWGKIWGQLITVDLDGNDIICDENIKWIYSKKLPLIFYGRCGPGNDLHKKRLEDLKLEDFK